ncbi:hypothetical protein GN956_G4177 [Arapaima gigas]
MYRDDGMSVRSVTCPSGPGSEPAARADLSFSQEAGKRAGRKHQLHPLGFEGRVSDTQTPPAGVRKRADQTAVPPGGGANGRAVVLRRKLSASSKNPSVHMGY